MRKNNRKWLAVAVACCCASALAEPVARRPADIPVSPDSQVRVALSNTNPNLLVVPGDRIVAVDSAQGMFINDNRAMGQANGGVQLMTAQTSPFTFYVRTEGGLTISVDGVPQKRDGRVLHFISGRPVRHEAARRWETSLPYVRMLTEIQKAVLAGALPAGFSEAPPVPLPPLTLPAWLKAEPVTMWNGGALRLYHLSVRNTGSAALGIPEHLFSAAGVRSVMIFPFSTTLMPGAQTSVWMTVSEEKEVKTDGQH